MELVKAENTLEKVESIALKSVNRGDYRRYVKEYFAFCRERNLAPVDTDTLEAYLEELGKRYHGGSFAPILSAIKSGLRGAARRLLSAQEAAAVSEILRTVKAPAKSTNAIRRDMILTHAEEKAVLELMSKRDSLVFRFLLKTGLRISEALGIRLSAVKPNHELVEITVMGKNKKIRTVKVCIPLYNEIREVFRGKEYLFETEKGKPLHRTYVYRRIAMAVKKAVGKRFSPHCLRHTFATRAIAKTGKIKAVADYLGHSSTSITLDMYTHEELTIAELDGI